MSRPGGYKRRPAGTLVEAQSRLVEMAGGLVRAGDLAGRSKSQVARYTDPADFQAMPADVVRCLEREAGEPVVSAFLAAEIGAVVLPLPAEPEADLHGHCRAMVERAAECFRLYGAAMADRTSPGRIDAAEAGALVAGIDRTLAALGALRAACRAVSDPAAGAPGGVSEFTGRRSSLDADPRPASGCHPDAGAFSGDG